MTKHCAESVTAIYQMITRMHLAKSRIICRWIRMSMQQSSSSFYNFNNSTTMEMGKITAFNAAIWRFRLLITSLNCTLHSLRVSFDLGYRVFIVKAQCHLFISSDCNFIELISTLIQVTKQDFANCRRGAAIKNQAHQFLKACIEPFLHQFRISHERYHYKG